MDYEERSIRLDKRETSNYLNKVKRGDFFELY